MADGMIELFFRPSWPYCVCIEKFESVAKNKIVVVVVEKINHTRTAVHGHWSPPIVSEA